LGILEKINNLKMLLKDISDHVSSLPKEVHLVIEKDTKALRDLANTMGGAVEKYFKDQLNLKQMTKDLSHKMNELDIYRGLSDRQKDIILDKIISNADLVLVNAEDLRLFIKDKLQTESVENLIKKAYSKKDIVRLGESVVPDDSGEVVKYDAGFKILQDMVKTPTGRKDAIAHGIKRLESNTTTLHYYLMLYYGAT